MHDIIQAHTEGGLAMLLRQMQYFAAVVETGSFTEAAESVK